MLGSCAALPLLLAAAAAAGQPQGIRLIGAGLPCTGTQSLQVALAELGYRAVHGSDFFFNLTLRKVWEGFLYGDGTFEQALQALLETGYDATLDMPAVAAWEQLLERYPEAKVLLTVRDSAEKWYDSYANKFNQKVWITTFVTDYLGWYHGIDNRHFVALDRKNQRLYGCNFQDDQTVEMRRKCIAGYNAHVDKVKRVVPAHQLLVYSVSEGWGPLCEFLGRPVPDTPFPRRDVTTLKLTGAIEFVTTEPGLSQAGRPLLQLVLAITLAQWLSVAACCWWGCRLYCRRRRLAKKKL